MNQATYFLPHLLALSTSSPFWEGFDTGLKAFRPTIFGNLPRSGVPEPFESFGDWSEMLRILAETGLCDDATKIWWDIRPSAKHPDARDAHLRHVHASSTTRVTIAALYQSILAFLYHLRANNQSWRKYRRIFVAENKWRAQRYGIQGSLADFGRRTLVPLRRSDRGADRAAARACARARLPAAARARARRSSANGTSADHQLRVYNAALEAGATSTRRRSASSTG